MGFVPTSMVYSTYGYKEGLRVYSFEGSASMKSAMDLLLFSYGTVEDIGINIQTIGSSGGLEKVLSGKTDFALVSHDVSEFKSKYNTQWESKKIRTLTLARELMTVVYKPPRGCHEDLVISSENIKTFYSVFSGHRHSEMKGSHFSDLLKNNNNPRCRAKIKAWVRSSGPTKSGTATAFVNNPILTQQTQQTQQTQDSAWLQKVKSPSYGNEVKTLFYAPESNALAFSHFVKNLRGGSMIYLPSSFVFTNWSIIRKLGLKVAKFKQNENEISLSKHNFKSQRENYKWERQFNLLYSVDTITGDSGKNKLVKYIAENVGSLEVLHLIPNNSCCSEIEKWDTTLNSSDQKSRK
ncbi:putative periplasmic phosphate-binding protein PstS (Mycoplasma type) [Mycoplasma haemofelis str. Langford 1]|uniref:Periplasmic phosphate-binding protein PstS (Mycoplasma type) n=1 Tax=Mycoplasma haemofelis (strain Langford 1) TaxID=941640 RepID=E8ZGJ8_MYCHL|nr:substrate-binding domain-containing protein [Mycoplasma haemofelis]CBY92028.1 putative periplasmic phosphate-binding protein PstS (Mycoplasma type) [Mycoplasma haemofelis str. Langford 1]